MIVELGFFKNEVRPVATSNTNKVTAIYTTQTIMDAEKVAKVRVIDIECGDVWVVNKKFSRPKVIPIEGMIGEIKSLRKAQTGLLLMRPLLGEEDEFIMAYHGSGGRFEFHKNSQRILLPDNNPKPYNELQIAYGIDAETFYRTVLIRLNNAERGHGNDGSLRRNIRNN